MTLADSLRNVAAYIKLRSGKAIEVDHKAPLWRDLVKAANEIDRLRGIVDKYPKCWGLNDAGELVQDVPVVPAMTLYREPGGYQFMLGEPCWDDLEGKWQSEYLGGADHSECCDSHEAAKERKHEKEH